MSYHQAFRWYRKHLHPRGESVRTPCIYPSVFETPPHTWRRLAELPKVCPIVGNTSTHVETICHDAMESAMTGKHLHTRGDDKFDSKSFNAEAETPPQTWRNLISWLVNKFQI